MREQLLVLALLLVPLSASARFHLWQITEVYSNADGRSIGLGSNISLRPVHRVEFVSSYNFLTTREREELAFGSDAALANPVFGTPPDDHLPTLRNQDHVLVTSLRFEVTKWLGLKLYHRFEYSTIHDYHQTGLTTLIDRRVYLGHVDRDYQANFFGIVIQISNWPGAA